MAWNLLDGSIPLLYNGTISFTEQFDFLGSGMQLVTVYHKVQKGSLWSHERRKSNICTLIDKDYIFKIVFKINKSNNDQINYEINIFSVLIIK